MTPNSHAPGCCFSPAELARITAETFIERLDYYEELPSTNSRALELAAAAPNDGRSVLVLADRQTAGRGRGDNAWWSSGGALTFSVLFRTPQFDLPVSRWPQLSLTGGLAVGEAIESLVSGATLAIKWPNDVYFHNRKLAGILVEGADGQRGSLVVGVGINVHNSAAAAPAELRDKAIALCDATAAEIGRIDVLVAVLQRLAMRIEWLAAGVDSLQETWSRRCLLTGRNVGVDVHSRRIAGLCRGIDRDGALVIATDAGPERCLSGVVIRFD